MKAQEIRQRVRWLMIFRVTATTLLLGSLAILQFYQQRSIDPAIYSIVAATYLLTIAYAAFYGSVRNFKLFAYIQIFGDVLLETVIVYSTGGMESAFSFTYIFSIFAGGIILFRRGGFLFASLAGIFYGVLVDLQFYGAIPFTPSRPFTVSELFYNIFLNFVAFYTVAFLASSLSERLKATKEELEEKSIDLLELQALNESIVRSMADGMVVIDLEGRITAFNQAAEEITGRGMEEAKGSSFSDFFNWHGLQTFFDDIEAAGKLPFRYELGWEREGRRMVLGMTLSPLRNEGGEIKGLLGIFQDLTHLKEMEREMKKKDRLAVIGELSAGMAHEIRNPLASLSGSLQVLKEDLDLSGENLRLMEIALEEMDRLNRIVTEFLTYARPKVPVKEGCDVCSIIRDTADLIRNSRDYREGIDVAAELPGGPVIMRADPGQLRQVVWNLSINAVQSVGESGRVRLRAVQDPKQVTIEVEDSGEGIRKEDMDRIFYPFFSTKPGGSGLGLAIVYRIIEEHGGSIRVDSAAGSGARFTVSLPVGGGA